MAAERDSRSLQPRAGAAVYGSLTLPPGLAGVIPVHHPKATGHGQTHTTHPLERHPDTLNSAMADATHAVKCDTEVLDYSARLNTIFEAFWAKLESRA
ncbi:Hypothetical predicted protein [Pelobates cultripes]|uniref:Uncharacterized protein n=1 Tax=Pelobates cultripes TaxID=61616 RepID=A0AAD1TEK4_PELCU|nr:Hypothetical predicted protein [Pelobates cultripes]